MSIESVGDRFNETLGDRIRAWRGTRQMSQAQLAQRSHVSVEYLRSIETGRRVPARGTLNNIAAALHVSVPVLEGQPHLGAEAEEPMHSVVPELYKVLLCYDAPDDLAQAPRPLPVLTAEVDQISAMRRDARYGPMGPLLPPLLTELTHVALDSAGETQQRAFWELARTYRAANSLAHKLGYQHLSSTALERVAWAAAKSGDLLMEVTAGYLKAGAMLRAGAYGPGTRLLERLMKRVESAVPEGCWREDQLAVYGALRLKLVMFEAQSGGGAENVRGQLAEARDVAAAMGGRDSLAYETSFGPTNIRIHEVAALLETGDTEQAVERVREWGREQRRDLWTPPESTVKERASHHHIDFAAAQLAEGDRGGALASLQEARKIAPQHTRHRPKARDTVSTLIRLEGDAPETLAGMARWISR
ncbi:helix-turn-helix domain-containing protein [Streptomyces daliensis]|uniref:Helix-turn-helix domain-containing protein n=1 Tax=Streptomyces daliensis TaxID=299421 RepID=A0A8T4J062_9ACTN|nr:helix-turn-helix domain-containing protein [Streptomyces daliensis]